mgnify:CR=1 FL=1
MPIKPIKPYKKLTLLLQISKLQTQETTIGLILLTLEKEKAYVQQDNENP